MRSDVDTRIAEVAAQGLRELECSDDLSIVRTSVADDRQTRCFRLREIGTGVEHSVCVEWSATDLNTTIDRFIDRVRQLI